MVGIVSYGVYIPKWRIKVEEIARVWGHDPEAIKRSLLVEEKSVPYLDEDTITISVEAAKNCLKRVRHINAKDIGAIYVGSESHPYSVKPSASIVAESLGITPSITAADTEFACKAATAALQACMGLVKAGYIKYGMVIGADTAQAEPLDALEYTAAAGGACFILGNSEVVAEIEGTFSFTQDVPDFWRRDGSEFPRHWGRFTGEPAYFAHVISCTQGLMDKLGLKPEDVDYVVFHQPNAKFPIKAASILGFSKEKILPGLVVTKIGNTYSASSLIGLAAILDKAKPGQRILMTSYGSGAGSDSFSFIVTDRIEDMRNSSPSVEYYVNRKAYIDYATYVKFKRLLK